ncbi:Piso0_002491 [Millerozyma farinosa CBS 7064]|uniref:Tubulin gamma chain n=1 Tax=Pichia sorbitophila (strain ATCC MYA-4447 / BCRC 22081 / CBS 7064 / NBRC 10061 / NRRL Y-12695) TaxID=559304 RepID=G8YCR6_PICSO|nr:Piso0_002491 [Millerozyma farinosa CBS 7064]
MPGETVTLQAGQCGNQVGLEYWQQLATEHGILADGTPVTFPSKEFQYEREGMSSGYSVRNDRPELFFKLSSSNKFTPRAILVDLEPSVIAKCTNTLPMFNPRNVHLSESGNGAANNWNSGYTYGYNHQEEILNLIDRECDKCDNFSNFQLIHSVAGGTGSGVGSLLLELLSDRYGSKKLLNTYSVFPSNEKTSDVVVQPYNTILTLKKLIEFSDGTLVFDNDAINSIENALFGISTGISNDAFNNRGSGAFQVANKLISFVLSGVSNPLRFPTYMYSSHESIFSTLIPTPDLKFLSASIAPFANLSNFESHVSKYNFTSLNEYDILLELLNDRYKMNKVSGPVNYISMLNYLIGNNLNQEEIRKGTLKVQQRVKFVPWTSPSAHSINCKKSVFTDREGFKGKSLNGIQISNNTSIIHVLLKTVKQFDLLAKREAYLNFYTESNNREERARVMDVFQECKESVLNVIEEYKACQAMSYLEDQNAEMDIV